VRFTGFSDPEAIQRARSAVFIDIKDVS
jgi:hypothetical protein